LFLRLRDTIRLVLCSFKGIFFRLFSARVGLILLCATATLILRPGVRRGVLALSRREYVGWVQRVQHDVARWRDWVLVSEFDCLENNAAYQGNSPEHSRPF